MRKNTEQNKPILSKIVSILIMYVYKYKMHKNFKIYTITYVILLLLFIISLKEQYSIAKLNYWRVSEITKSSLSDPLVYAEAIGNGKNRCKISISLP